MKGKAGISNGNTQENTGCFAKENIISKAGARGGELICGDWKKSDHLINPAGMGCAKIVQ